MPAIKITPERVVAYARVLRTARTARALSDEGFEKLHAAFVARTPDGVPWTVGLETGKWNRAYEGRWAPDDPPTALYLESEVLFELERLKSAIESRDPGTVTALPPVPGSAITTAQPPEAQPIEAQGPKADAGVGAGATITSAAPPEPVVRRAPERVVERPRTTEWSPMIVSLVLGAALAAIGAVKSSAIALGAAGLMALVLVTMFILHFQSKRH